MTNTPFASIRRDGRFALGLAVAVAACAPAVAETADTLRAALRLVPATAAPSERIDVEFLDLAKAAAVTGRRGGDALQAMIGRIAFSATAGALGRAINEPEPWRRATGFGLEHVDMLLQIGRASCRERVSYSV